MAGRSYDSGKQVLQQDGKCLDASAPSELAMADCNGAAVSLSNDGLCYTLLSLQSRL